MNEPERQESAGWEIKYAVTRELWEENGSKEYPVLPTGLEKQKYLAFIDGWQGVPLT